MTPAIKAQRAYRARRSAKIDRMRKALEKMRDRLQGNDRPLAVELMAMIEHALSGDME